MATWVSILSFSVIFVSLKYITIALKHFNLPKNLLPQARKLTFTEMTQ